MDPANGANPADIASRKPFPVFAVSVKPVARQLELERLQIGY
jgi:hypothetical protein